MSIICEHIVRGGGGLFLSPPLAGAYPDPLSELQKSGFILCVHNVQYPYKKKLTLPSARKYGFIHKQKSNSKIF